MTVAIGNLKRGPFTPPPVDVLPFKTLILKLTQAGVVAPVVNSSVDDIGVAYTLNYVDLGEYTVDFVSPIAPALADIHCIAPVWQAEGSSNYRAISIGAISTIQLRIRTGLLLESGNVFWNLEDDILGQSSTGTGDSFVIYVPNP
jgi:hypothetical protein